MKLIFLLLISAQVTKTFCGEFTGGNSTLSRVCYLCAFFPDLDLLNQHATLCTHIIAGFASVEAGLVNVGNDDYKIFFRNITSLKQHHPELKVLLTVGGGGNFNGFSSAFNSALNRTRFIASALTVLNDFDFDGLDIDWEFPVWNDFYKSDKENFVLFLKEFKSIAKLLESITGEVPLLTVAVAGPKTIIDKSYNVKEMAKYVDFINLMSYDYHDYFWYTPFTGHNSPLYNRSVERAYFATLNTAWSAFYWNHLGMPKSKIMVGIPTYGHSYELLEPEENGVDAPSVGMGPNEGSASYPEVCELLNAGGVRVFDEESQVPYVYKDYDWISYEDEQSMRGKAEWIKAHGFGGAMTFSLNADDWAGVCKSGPFPLHRVLYNVFTN